MESELAAHLSAVARSFAETRGLELSTVGKLAARDRRFFTNLDSADTTFTARKYDEVMSWFSDRWPEGASWPEGVPRPEPKPLAGSEPAGAAA